MPPPPPLQATAAGTPLAPPARKLPPATVPTKRRRRGAVSHSSCAQSPSVDQIPQGIVAFTDENVLATFRQIPHPKDASVRHITNVKLKELSVPVLPPPPSPATAAGTPLAPSSRKLSPTPEPAKRRLRRGAVPSSNSVQSLPVDDIPPLILSAAEERFFAMIRQIPRPKDGSVRHITGADLMALNVPF